ncbi:MAG: thiamine-phosphate kinase [Deltaproteobacteria bacterium RBG_13_58_19]|nr:MAG: thiamine-phosphate kinase [Deltaproteobacteria bacterium RBG_13_58_19]
MEKPPAGEVGLILALAQRFGATPPEVILGIGDDCAAMDLGGPDFLLWTIDTLVEGVHFDPAYITLTQLGHKSLAVNLSDIAAMGGEPLYALLSLGWPPGRDLAGALALGQGLAQEARKYGVSVIGGDTVASPQGLAVTVSVLGRVPRGEMLRRAGARPGDEIYVTGPLGEAAAGLEILRRGLKIESEIKEPLIQAHLSPQPQLKAGRLLAREGLASALIDLSDGVASDLYHICRAGGVGARLKAQALPLSPQVRAVAQKIGLDPLDLALRGGEDYQLLFTSPREKAASLAQVFSQAGLAPPIFLGEIISGEEVWLKDGDKEKIISGTGYDHFPLDLDSP